MVTDPASLAQTDWSSIREYQGAQLPEFLKYLRSESELYRERLDGVNIEEINSVAALAQVPFLSKDDIRASLAAAPPLGRHACVDYDSIIQVQSSSGTTGLPTYVGTTSDDLDDWRETVARVYETNGFRPGESCLHAYGLSKGFVGGIPILQGLQELGVNVLPIGAESGIERLLHAIEDLEPENLVATPHFARYLGRQADDVLGRSANGLSIQRVSCGGEPGLDALREELMDIWGADVVQVMGATEIAPAYFGECEEHNLHMVRPDLYLPEILDPETGAQLEWSAGTTGELVVTTLGRQASPVLRYRLGDIVTVDGDSCPCGLAMPSITCHGRTDDMLIVRGVNVFPNAIQDVINDFAGDSTGSFRVLKDFDGHATDSRLRVAVEYPQTQGERSERIRTQLTEAIRSRLGVSVDIELVSPQTFTRPEDGKVSLVKDVPE